ncbi:uncharacterized protein LOC126900898 isoform X2 [Daktulosphaira vitifoliae]|uniref:uncharacterized protein LOC126900898 isoform X2 n=1 Tax=Daktulosphaira vitifoliae TaxID=58002 RepID=UPI0021A983EC|nr:uncharacterized protein LOC126900898 isoform X2 [Daktulosphaira vitifoliae]
MKFNIILFSLVGCFNYAVGSGSSSAVTNNEQKKTPLYNELINDLKMINNINKDKVSEGLIGAGLSRESVVTILENCQNEVNDDTIINDTQWYGLIMTLIDNDRQKELVPKVLTNNCYDNISQCLMKAGLSQDSIGFILNGFYKEDENINLNDLTGPTLSKIHQKTTNRV